MTDEANPQQPEADLAERSVRRRDRFKRNWPKRSDDMLRALADV